MITLRLFPHAYRISNKRFWVFKEEIFFRGFYSQGEGSGFTAEIAPLLLLVGIVNQNWKAYAPKLELDLIVPDIYRRVLKLVKERKLVAAPRKSRTPPRLLCKAELNENLPYSYDGYPQIEKQLDILEDGLIKIAEILNRFKRMNNRLPGGLEANEYWFTADGKNATPLES